MNLGHANAQAGEDLRGHTSPACGTIPLPRGHCECNYANFDATNHPIAQPMGHVPLGETAQLLWWVLVSDEDGVMPKKIDPALS
jgi:hypothetical protein